MVRLARNEAHEKADTYAATLDEVKARADLLDKESLQRLLVGLLGDPVRAKVAKEAISILKSSSGPQHLHRADFVTHDRSLAGILGALIVIALVIWLANVFSINALLSSLIERPVGGSGTVRISLASEISDHCFVEVLFYRKFVFPLFSPGTCTSV